MLWIKRNLFLVVGIAISVALLGGAAGVALAVGAVRLVIQYSPARLPRLDQISVDATALFFAFTVSIAAGFVFGAIPVLKHGGVRLAEALRAGGRTASAGRERNLTRNLLTVVQVALALVLLIGSGLMIRTFLTMRNVQPGFNSAESLQTVRVSIPRSVALKEPEVLLMQQAIANRLAALPGVSAVGLIGGLPMTGASSQDPVFSSDRVYAANQIPPLRRFITAMPGTFQTLGVPLVAGREYTWTDIHERRRIVIIGDNFAREYWGAAAAAIGKQIRRNPNDQWSEVIGVVGDVRHDGVDKPAPSSVYWPPRGDNSLTYLIRGERAGTESLATEIRQAVWAVNPSAPLTEMRTMRDVYERSMARTAFTLALLGISGFMALLLAAVGIYAVIAYTVAQRTREIGIRLALGAQEGRVKMLFVQHGLLWGGIGAAVGLCVAAALARLMSTLLHEISPFDPLTYAAVAFGLLGAAAVASYLPARRVARVDPVEALRAE